VNNFIIYIIGSLKNKNIPYIANEIRELGFEVFDDWFSPGPNADDHWRDYEKARSHTYKEALQGWAGKHVFEFDKFHIDRSDIGILIMPAGKSGHLELGYMIGQGKTCFILFEEEPERYDVMYQFANDVFFDKNELFDTLKTIRKDIG
jgi:nucleoside 2-deoxyribosyltransferase